MDELRDEPATIRRLVDLVTSVDPLVVRDLRIDDNITVPVDSVQREDVSRHPGMNRVFEYLDVLPVRHGKAEDLHLSISGERDRDSHPGKTAQDQALREGGPRRPRR